MTAPAVADELAGRGRAGPGQARPAGRSRCVRGRADLVLPPGEDGPGAAALVRAEGADMFGYGAREAVVRALRGDPADQAPFGAPAAADELAAAARATLARRRGRRDATATRRRAPAAADRRGWSPRAAFAHGWEVVAAADDGPSDGSGRSLRPAPP